MAKYEVLAPVAYIRGGRVSRHKVGDVVELEDAVAMKLYRKLSEIHEQPEPPQKIVVRKTKTSEPELTETSAATKANADGDE